MADREYKTLKALHKGEVVDIGAGILVRKIPGEIVPGDLYIAERNTGPKLLTCRKVNKEERWVVPEEIAYIFDIQECVRIEEA